MDGIMMFDILTNYDKSEDWEEVEQETKRRIIFSLNEEDNQFLSQLCNNTDRANSTLSDHLSDLNDLSVVHHPGNQSGFKLINDNIKIKRKTDKYISDLIYYLLPVAFYLGAVYYTSVYSPLWSLPLTIGFLIGFVTLLSRKMYIISSQEDYLTIYRKVNDFDTELEHNFSSN